MEDMYYFEQLKKQLRRYRVVEQTQEDPHTIEIVKNFFIEHPEPSDKDVHEFADKIGMPTDRLETIAYGLLSNLLQVGKHKDVPDDQFDAEQLNMGIEIEREHTDDLELAKEIAKDHLAEFPDYYTKLKKMESEGKAKK
jgi:hypothetical protein